MKPMLQKAYKFARSVQSVQEAYTLHLKEQKTMRTFGKLKAFYKDQTFISYYEFIRIKCKYTEYFVK